MLRWFTLFILMEALLRVRKQCVLLRTREGHLNEKGRPVAGLGIHGDASSVLLNHFPGKHKPQAGPFGSFGREKLME
jgi:hypothetical protein